MSRYSERDERDWRRPLQHPERQDHTWRQDEEVDQRRGQNTEGGVRWERGDESEDKQSDRKAS